MTSSGVGVSLVVGVITEETRAETPGERIKAEGNLFSRHHYASFRGGEGDTSKYGKLRREVLPVKDNKTSLRRKRLSRLEQELLERHS